MKTYGTRLAKALDIQLYEISHTAGTQENQFKYAILTCKKAMINLKNYIARFAFENGEEEIHYFKAIKPRVYSLYIYHVNLYNYILQKPAGGTDVQTSYILSELSRLHDFFEHNRAFYAYYRSGMTQMDDLYFTRNGFDVHAELDDFDGDNRYCSSHDYKLSKLIANEKYQEFLNKELGRLNSGIKDLDTLLPFKRAQWTAGQTDAIELIYALKASGSVNKGNIDIAELVSIFEFVFQIELKEYYHKFTDITRRKKDMTIFLNKLKDGLMRWIDDKMSL